MATINICFKFETKEQWLEFGKKFFNEKEFIDSSPLAKQLKKKNKTFNEFVNVMETQLDMIGSFLYLQTSSKKLMELKKLMEKLGDFIIENKYENNFSFRRDILRLRLEDLKIF